MIKHQIETMLNIKGKDMPSVEEEFGSSGTSHFDISKNRNTLELNYICMTSNVEHLSLFYHRNILQQFCTRKY